MTDEKYAFIETVKERKKHISWRTSCNEQKITEGV